MDRTNQLPPPPRLIRPFPGGSTRFTFWGENLMASGIAAVGIALLSAAVLGCFTGWNDRVGGNAMAFYYAILANLVFTPIYYLTWIVRAQERRLYTLGAEAEGVITQKRVHKGEGDSFVVEYSFEDIRGVQRKHWKEIWKDQWDAAAVGDVLVVLYSTTNSKRSIPYTYGNFEVDTETCTKNSDTH